MRILQINKHHFLLGGAEKYYLSLTRLLVEKKNEVAFFSVRDKRNIDTPWDKYFIKNLSFEKPNLSGYLNILVNMLFPFELRNNFRALLDDFQPDVIHIHNIHNYMYPIIEFEILKRKIPVIRTLHDYGLISPNVILYHDQKQCEHSKNGLLAVVKNKCVKNSYLASFSAGSLFYLRRFIDRATGFPDYLIAPSLFMKRKVTEYGVRSEKTVHIGNFVDHQGKGSSLNGKKTYILYFGRLLEHKGLELLLEAASMLPEVNFKIAGTGPEEKKLKTTAGRMGLSNVEFLGWLGETQLKKTIINSYICTVPSLWPENFPYSILEAFSFGKTVVASKTGGIPEIVKDGKNGLLFKTGDSSDLAAKLKALWRNSKLVEKMGKNARKLIEIKFNNKVHYKKIIGLYQKAINENKNSG